LDPRARAELATRLSAILAQRYSLTVDGAPEPFLEQLTS
jgi:hypothetical protein